MRALDDLLSGVGLHQHGNTMAVVLLTDFGDSQLAGGALHQADADTFFQRDEAAAEGRLGHSERTSGGSKAAVIHDLHEIIELVEILHASLSCIWDDPVNFTPLINLSSRTYTCDQRRPESSVRHRRSIP